MDIVTLSFAPPIQGMESLFNTFRLGGVWYNRVEVGMRVFLHDTKRCVVFGMGIVRGRERGQLGVLAATFAADNHNQLVLPDPDLAAERLIKAMKRRYGPHKVSETSLVSVIYIEREG